MTQEETRKIDEAARQARNEYQRNWRAANKEKVRKSNADYWRRKAMAKHGQEVTAQGG